MKKLAILFTCWSLAFNALLLQGSGFSSHFATMTERAANVIVSDAYAQADAITLSAKKESKGFAQQYLPMLAMLGVGIMTIMLFKNLKKKTADFYLFLMGSVIYLVSVITSWTSEKKELEALSDKIDKDAQVGALEEQKKSYEKVLKMVKKRMTLQAAATASYLAAAVLAGVFYMNEKASRAAMKNGTLTLKSEMASKCQKIIQFQSPPSGIRVNAQNNKPIMQQCMAIMAQGQSCLANVSASEAVIETTDETLRSPDGSASMDSVHTGSLDNIHNVNQACFDINAPPENSISYSDPNLKNKLRKLYEDNNIDILKPNRLLVETDDISSQATKTVVRILNELVAEAEARVGATAARLLRNQNASLADGAEQAATAAVSKENYVGDQFSEIIDPNAALERCQNSGNCTGQILPAYIDFNDAQRNLINQGTGAASDTAVGYGAKLITKKVATRAAVGVVVRVVGASAIAAAAPVLVAPAAIILTGVTAVQVGTAAYHYAVSHHKVMVHETAERRKNMDCKKTKRGMRCRPKSAFIDFFNEHKINNEEEATFFKILNTLIPNANASLVPQLLSGISPQATEVAEEVTSKSENETDMWLFNPKGRMILYGAFSALLGFITMSTSKMKKNLEEDITVIQNMIDELGSLESGSAFESDESDESENNDEEIEESASEDNASVGKFNIINEVFSFFVNNAYAKGASIIGQLPVKMPCLAPYRGRCISPRKYLSKMLPPGIPLGPIMMKSLSTSADMASMIQQKNYVTADFMEKAKELSLLKPKLEIGLKINRKVINRQLASSYKEKPIPFDTYSEKLKERYLDFSREAISKNTNVNFGSLFGNQLYRTNTKEKGIMPKRQEVAQLTTTCFSNPPVNNNTFYDDGMEVQEIPEEPVVKHKGSFKNLGINTSTRDDIFKQLSSRYRKWQYK